MTRPSRSRQIVNLQELIKEVAWRQIAESGASSLSLRKIARELTISAPAIYNYFADRDALVTALIVDAYASFGDYQIRARDSFPEKEQLLDRFRATGVAYREWALIYPQRYLLIFGTPVPGYVPPMDELLPVMMRSLSALVSVISELHAAGRLNAGQLPSFSPGPREQFFACRNTVKPGEMVVHTLAMLVWSRVHGLVSLEITGQLPPFGEDGSLLYEFELNSVLNQFVVV